MATLRPFLNRHILRQYTIGPWLGAFKDLLGRTVFYMTPINLFMLAATTYHVTAKDFIWQFAPWVNFWMFFAALVLAAVCAMVFEYKVVFPSSVFFSNLQGYKHGNLIRRDLETIMQEIKKIDARLDAIDAKYDTHSGHNSKTNE
jgi:hypothetical protein